MRRNKALNKLFIPTEQYSQVGIHEGNTRQSGSLLESFLPLNHNSPSLFKSFLDGLLDFLRMQEEDLVLGLLEEQEKKARGEEK